MSTASLCARLALTLACTLIACGGGDDDDTGGGAAGDEGGGTAGSDAKPASGSCKENALFAPRALGDGAWVITEVQPDPASGDVFFSTGKALYVVRKGTQEAQLITERPTDVGGDFWLIDDGFLFPSGFQIPLVDQEIAVLFSMPRSGGEAVVEVAAPVSNTAEGWEYQISDVVLAGDDVYWVATDKFSAEPWRTPPEYDSTYFVRKTSWRAPGEPQVLYESKHELSGLLLAGGMVFIDEAQSDEIDSSSDQRMLALDGSGAQAMTAWQRYGGEVMAGDDESLFVMNTDYEKPEEFGAFRVAPDGGEKEKLGDLILLGIGELPAAHLDGRWVFLNASMPGAVRLQVYEVGKGLREIGCVDSDYEGGLAIGPDAVYLGIRHDETGNTVLKFDL